MGLSANWQTNQAGEHANVSFEYWYFIQIQGKVIQINDKGKIIDDYNFGGLKMDKEYQWNIAPIDDEGYYIKEEEE